VGDRDKVIPAIAKKIAEIPKKDGRKKRVVIVTQGGDPTIVVMGDQVMTVKLP